MILDPSDFIEKWGTFAPIIIFSLAVLAGLNIPISIDILITITAIIASNYLPEKTFILFLFFTLGCIVAAWVSYTLGRFFGKYIKSDKAEKIRAFYKKFGFFAFIICRFIPFGVRNAFFMTSGFSKIPFKKFAIFDAIACTIWSSLLFSLIYKLGKNFDVVLTYLKHFNIVIFTLFAFALSIFLSLHFYKKRKRLQ